MISVDSQSQDQSKEKIHKCPGGTCITGESQNCTGINCTMEESQNCGMTSLCNGSTHGAANAVSMRLQGEAGDNSTNCHSNFKLTSLNTSDSLGNISRSLDERDSLISAGISAVNLNDKGLTLEQAEHECETVPETFDESSKTDKSVIIRESDNLSDNTDVSSTTLPENSGEKCEASSVSSDITYVEYESEKQMPDIMRLITKDLSEPYSIYTYRYFIHNWPKLCFLAMHGDECIGAIVSKLDSHKKSVKRGYIAMLAVAQDYRKRGIGSQLVIRAIRSMVSSGCDEVVLETEITNKAALHLYENLGFVRDKRLFRYYLNGVDALRLKLWIR